MSKFRENCPGCGQAMISKPFYHCESVPANSVVLFRSRHDALNCPKGNIHLTCCSFCGLVYNSTYDPLACQYNENYEESQSHSEVFNAFHYELADYLLNKYDLKGKNILEIGCGKGDFLNMICSMGDNTGTGYDPSYVSDRSKVERSDKVTIFNREFPCESVHIPADFIICKMTLEHITETADFLKQIRKSIAPDRRTKIFFQVPDAKPILEQSRFWDIYYEHCSYFTNNSLAQIFRLCGFEVLCLSEGYDGQYLLLEAEPDASDLITLEQTATPEEMELAKNFAYSVQVQMTAWIKQLKEWHGQDKKVALWGGGSKAVSFLTSLKINEEVQAVIDINPHKQGTFLPGTGHEIVAPPELKRIRPDIIVIMNPIYQEEIKRLISELEIEVDTIPVSQHELQKIQPNVKPDGFA